MSLDTVAAFTAFFCLVRCHQPQRTTCWIRIQTRGTFLPIYLEGPRWNLWSLSPGSHEKASQTGNLYLWTQDIPKAYLWIRSENYSEKLLHALGAVESRVWNSAGPKALESLSYSVYWGSATWALVGAAVPPPVWTQKAWTGVEVGTEGCSF